jgi:hypothetical protein
MPGAFHPGLTLGAIFGYEHPMRILWPECIPPRAVAPTIAQTGVGVLLYGVVMILALLG